MDLKFSMLKLPTYIHTYLQTYTYKQTCIPNTNTHTHKLIKSYQRNPDNQQSIDQGRKRPTLGWYSSTKPPAGSDAVGSHWRPDAFSTM